MEVTVHFTGEVISTSEQQQASPPSPSSPARLAGPPRLGVSTNCNYCPTGGELVLITSSPQRMPDNATYIKVLSSQRAAGVFMRYFTLYGARGGHTNPAPLPFRVAKAEPCTQTAGTETVPEARKVTRRRRARGKERKRKTPQPDHQCPGLRENRKLVQLI